MKRIMKSALDAIVSGIDNRFEHLVHLHKSFCFLLDTASLMSDDDSDFDDLKAKCNILAAAYPDDVDGDRLAEEIQDCRILVKKGKRLK